MGLGPHWVPVHAVCHGEFQEVGYCACLQKSSRHPSLSCPFSLQVTGVTKQKPDCCTPLLENLQCFSFACEVKSTLLVWPIESFTAGCILPSQPHTSQSLEHAVFLFFLSLFLMKLERECPFQPFSDWSVSYSSFNVPSNVLRPSWGCPQLCPVSTLLGMVCISLVFV